MSEPPPTFADFASLAARIEQSATEWLRQHPQQAVPAWYLMLCSLAASLNQAAALAAPPDQLGGQARYEMVQEVMLERRGIRGEPCPACVGWGVRTYSSTATWRGGIGGQAMTDDVCDRCWGSGDAGRPWPSRRAAPPDRQEQPRDRWNGVGAEMPQYAVLGIGPEAWVDLESAERYAVDHKHTDRSHVSIRVGTLRLVMKVLRAIRLDDFRAAPVPQGERAPERSGDGVGGDGQ